MAFETLHTLLDHPQIGHWLHTVLPSVFDAHTAHAGAAIDAHGVYQGTDSDAMHLTAASGEAVTQAASNVGTEGDYLPTDPAINASDIELERYVTYLLDHAQHMLQKCLALQSAIGGPGVDPELDRIIRGLQDEIRAISDPAHMHDREFLKQHAGEIRELKDWAKERARELAQDYRKG